MVAQHVNLIRDLVLQLSSGPGAALLDLSLQSSRRVVVLLAVLLRRVFLLVHEGLVEVLDPGLVGHRHLALLHDQRHVFETTVLLPNLVLDGDDACIGLHLLKIVETLPDGLIGLRVLEAVVDGRLLHVHFQFSGTDGLPCEGLALDLGVLKLAL